MKLFGNFAVVMLCAALAIPAWGQKTAAPGLAQLEKMTARFAPTPLRVDVSRLSDGDRQALVKLIEAGRIMDEVFLIQYWSGNPALYSRLQKDATPLGKARLQYFWINKGPWSVLDNFDAFIPGVPPEKLKGANFYPENMTKPEFETWAASLAGGRAATSKRLFHGDSLEARLRF